MENKSVGWIIIGMAAAIIVIILIFNSALHDIVKSSCGELHSLVCPMNNTISEQTGLALAIVGILVIFGLVLILSKPKEKIIFKKIKEVRKEIDTSHLTSEEKKVLNIISQNKAIFQADLIEKTGVGKVKMSRLLDRLEGIGAIERKRRGMNNVIVLK